METRVTLLIQNFHKTQQSDPDENENHNRTAVRAAHLTLFMLIPYRFSQFVTKIVMCYPTMVELKM
jgi:hypothetical protein